MSMIMFLPHRLLWWTRRFREPTCPGLPIVSARGGGGRLDIAGDKVDFVELPFTDVKVAEVGRGNTPEKVVYSSGIA